MISFAPSTLGKVFLNVRILRILVCHCHRYHIFNSVENTRPVQGQMVIQDSSISQYTHTRGLYYIEITFIDYTLICVTRSYCTGIFARALEGLLRLSGYLEFIRTNLIQDNRFNRSRPSQKILDILGKLYMYFILVEE